MLVLRGWVLHWISLRCHNALRVLCYLLLDQVILRRLDQGWVTCIELRRFLRLLLRLVVLESVHQGRWLKNALWSTITIRIFSSHESQIATWIRINLIDDRTFGRLSLHLLLCKRLLLLVDLNRHSPHKLTLEEINRNISNTSFLLVLCLPRWALGTQDLLLKCLKFVHSNLSSWTLVAFMVLLGCISNYLLLDVSFWSTVLLVWYTYRVVVNRLLIDGSRVLEACRICSHCWNIVVPICWVVVLV